MQILGITGGIATGKSTVAGMFAELGAATHSADAIARTLLAPDTDTTKHVLAAFPDSRDQGDQTHCAVDRAALARKIFSDPAARKRLESLTHPAIIEALAAQSRTWRALPSTSIGVLEIPLLFEAGLRHLVDRVVVVSCSEETQISRLQARRGITRQEALQQISAQWPVAQKIAMADNVISTDCDLADTRLQVLAVWKHCIDEEKMTIV